MKVLILNNGKEVLIDDVDYELVIKYSWYYQKRKTTEYAITCITKDKKKTHFYMHQLIMGTIGAGVEIDHKDHNGLNNQRKNLSKVSHSDSIKNRRKHRGTSKYWGVNLHLGKKWRAAINIEGTQKHIGLYDREEDAARAYNKAALATLNPYYRFNDV